MFTFSLLEHMFQFPSNGKVVPNRNGGSRIYLHRDVSIPFKRESSSEPRWLRLYNHLKSKFQFPSNGKVVPNILLFLRLAIVYVFQFPSNGKVVPNRQKQVSSTMIKSKFQFPSNGIVFPNVLIQHKN